MSKQHSFDVIIVGGSYSGLSAAMALGRALRQVLIIDSGLPCNRQTPHSHNFITQDGKTPQEIASLAREQVSNYKTVQFYEGLATHAQKTGQGFEVGTATGERFTAKKLILASGIKDLMPDIAGFRECWGISVIHCPYCHGYEVRHEATGIFANGEMAFDFTKLVFNWTKELSLLTNGPSQLSAEQTEALEKHGIKVITTELERVEHEQGQLKTVIFKDGTTLPLKALYAKLPFAQHSDLAAQLDCAFTDHGHIQADAFQKTSVPGVYACGDNTSFLRSVSNAVATGTLSGAMVNKEIVDEEF